MAIRDLFWACPICHRTGTLQSHRRADRCTACYASFRRGRGAEIVAANPQGERLVMSAPEWLQRVAGVIRENGSRPQTAPVRLRIASGKRTITRDGELLGWRDRPGPARRGILELADEQLRFRGAHGSSHEWPLDDITAVQPSSSSLQIKARGQPVASIRFPLDSVRLWEDRIQDAIRRRWRAAGRGEIVEFQPMIRAW